MVPDARELTWDTGGKQLALRIVRGVIQLHSIQVRSRAEASCLSCRCRSHIVSLSAGCVQVVHCDITPSNILLNKAWTEAKIGDVGLGRYMLGSRLSPVSRVFGTLCYIAPEVHRSVRQDEASGVAQHYCNEKVNHSPFVVCVCVAASGTSLRIHLTDDVVCRSTCSVWVYCCGKW